MTDSVAVRPPRAHTAGRLQVVLVHGAMDRAGNFERVRKRLEDLPVISYDRRGYGASRHLDAEADLSAHVSDLLGVIGSNPTVLIGHSFGGLISLATAIEAPEHVHALGVYEAPMPWFHWWPERLEFTDPEHAAELFFREIVGDHVWDGATDSFRADRRSEGEAVIADFATATAGLAFDLADILSPVSAAHGSRTAVHFKDSTTELCSRIFGTRLTIIDGASHAAHMSHPQAFADWIRQTLGIASPHV